MLKGCAVLAMFLTLMAWWKSPGAADETPPSYILKWKNGNSLTITPQPCAVDAGVWFKTWKRAEYVWEGKVIEACWRLTATGIVTVDSAGDAGIYRYPLIGFHKVETY